MRRAERLESDPIKVTPPSLESSLRILGTRYIILIGLCIFIVAVFSLLSTALSRETRLLNYIRSTHAIGLLELSKISDRYQLILRSNDTLGETTKERARQDLINSISRVWRLEAEITEYSQEAESSLVANWFQPLELTMSILTDNERRAIEWFERSTQNRHIFHEFEDMTLANPTYSVILLRRPWNRRVELEIDRIAKLEAHYGTLQKQLMYSSFFAIGTVITLLSLSVLRPAFGSLRSEARNSAEIINIQRRFADLLRRIPEENEASYELGYLERFSRLNQFFRNALPDGLRLEIRASRTHQAGSQERIIHYLGHKDETSQGATYELAAQISNEFRPFMAIISPYIAAISNGMMEEFEHRQRMQAEEARRNYHEMTSQTIERLPQPIAIFDANGQSLFSNTSFRELFSIPKGHEISQGKIDLLERSMRRSHFEANGIFTLKASILAPDIVYQNGQRLSWTRADMPETGTIFIAQDITELYARLELQEHSRRLEALGKLSGSISHDTNNYLAVIQNAVELSLLEETNTKERFEALSLAIDNCQHAAALNRQILSYTRRQSLQPQATSISECINDINMFLHNRALPHLKLENNVVPTHYVYVDPSMLISTLINVVKNSVEALDGKGRIQISSSWASTDMIQIRVRDDGQGFSDKGLSQALHPFYTDKGEGHGLGLAAAEGFARQSGGRIDIFNENGAVVDIFLPAARGPEIMPKRANAITAQQPSSFHEQLRIFLLEDNEQLNMTLKRFLDAKGHKVSSALSLKEAFDQYEEIVSSDLLISDLMLPDGKSSELVNRIASSHPNMPMFLMTGYGDTVLSELALDEPVKVLFKPFALSELEGLISERFVA